MSSRPNRGYRRFSGRRSAQGIRDESCLRFHTHGRSLPLLRAVGVGLAIELAARLGVQTRWPRDAIIVRSSGDASVNHSTAAGTPNVASQYAFRGSPLAVLLVCEDNGSVSACVRRKDSAARRLAVRTHTEATASSRTGQSPATLAGFAVVGGQASVSRVCDRRRATFFRAAITDFIRPACWTDGW
jgi:hypothetical protein